MIHGPSNYTKYLRYFNSMRKSRINITKITEIKCSIELIKKKKKKDNIAYKHSKDGRYYTYLQKSKE